MHDSEILKERLRPEMQNKITSTNADRHQETSNTLSKWSFVRDKYLVTGQDYCNSMVLVLHEKMENQAHVARHWNIPMEWAIAIKTCWNMLQQSAQCSVVFVRYKGNGAKMKLILRGVAMVNCDHAMYEEDSFEEQALMKKCAEEARESEEMERETEEREEMIE
ncbi:hypothetical protein ARMGADRAFT_1038395 [Armillaria gallica]|uniref:Uncharacterized protein n=1 Tax=Armillaria gallica TaxID=47427 RepID=A0A2H3D5H1_ARMGA|nr:hypothetical protein ARMGADRAFT_1038395 [Armillaria gallica]